MSNALGASYKICDVAGKGLGLIAVRDVRPGELILAETPILHVDLDPRRNPQLFKDPKFREATEELVRLGKRFGHLEGAARYPAEARRALDWHSQLAAEHEFAKLSRVSQERVMALADAFVLQPQAKVAIANMADKPGRTLNGKVGTITAYNSEANMWEVSFSESPIITDMIKTENLVGLAGQAMSEKKSVGGVFKTNALLGLSICEKLCRVNHSCSPNAIWQTVETTDDIHLARRLIQGLAHFAEEPAPRISMGDHLLFATSEIAAGSEILISYLPEDGELTTLERRESLKRYNFKCACEACGDGSTGVVTTIVANLNGWWTFAVLFGALVCILARLDIYSRLAPAEL